MAKRKIISAGYGIGDWLLQRVTAVIMVVAIIEAFVFIVLANDVIDVDFITWRQFFSFTFVKVFAQLTFIAVAVHAWVGMRDIWMDYIHSYSARLALHAATILWLLGCLIYSAKIIWL